MSLPTRPASRRFRKLRTTAFALGLACAGCQPGAQTAGPPREFVALGRVDFRNFSAAFSDDRVVGPAIDVSRRGDGSWAGRIRGAVVDVNVYRGAVRGSGLTASWEETPDGVVVDSSCYGHLLHVAVNGQAFAVRSAGRAAPSGGQTVNVPGLGPVSSGEGAGMGLAPADEVPTGGANSFTLQRVGPNEFQGGLKLEGQAAQARPPETQFALMLIGAFD